MEAKIIYQTLSIIWIFSGGLLVFQGLFDRNPEETMSGVAMIAGCILGFATGITH